MFVLSCVSAFSQTNPPTAEEFDALKKENAELRAKCQALEAKLAQQQPTSKPADKETVPGGQRKATDDAKTDQGKDGKVGQKLNPNDFLLQMESYAVRYKKAQTSVLKGDVLKEMLETADAMVKDKTVSATGRVKDVRVKGLDAVELSVVSLTGYEPAPRSGSLLSPVHSNSSGTILLRMSAEDARKLLPGTAFTLSGTPFFEAHGSSAPQSGTLLVLFFAIKDAGYNSGGAIMLSRYDCKIGPNTYSSAR